MTDQATPAKVRLTDGLGAVAPPGWSIETGTGGFSDKGDRWACVRHLESQCGQDFYEDRDRLMFHFLLAVEAETLRLKDAVRSARADEAHCWASRVDGLTAQLREVDARYMALLKAVADGRAMQPAPAIVVDLGPNVRAELRPAAREE
jgi:hypothetical protein